MSGSFPVAVIQMSSTTDKGANLELAEQLVTRAARDGARLVVLPELFNLLGPFTAILAGAEPIPGPTSERCAALARRLGIYLCAGSICEQATAGDRGYNTSLLFDPEGRVLNAYRKIHLFRLDLPGHVRVDESQHLLPGDSIAVTDTVVGRIGQATCYDLRFPELFRRLAQQECDIVAFPSAFTRVTGAAHWELLVRARAIENQCFVLAANQCGKHGPDLETYGHSMISDAWGNVLTAADGTSEDVFSAEINLQSMREIRQRLPALANRRDFLQ
jgi:predicted amidohydrolase